MESAGKLGDDASMSKAQARAHALEQLPAAWVALKVTGFAACTVMGAMTGRAHAFMHACCCLR
jgi:hypothetical protein